MRQCGKPSLLPAHASAAIKGVQEHCSSSSFFWSQLGIVSYNGSAFFLRACLRWDSQFSQVSMLEECLRVAGDALGEMPVRPSPVAVLRNCLVNERAW